MNIGLIAGNIQSTDYIADFSPILTVDDTLADTQTTYRFSINLLAAIGIDTVIETEFPIEMTISGSPTITGDICLGVNVNRVSNQIIRVETSQICEVGSFSMDITSVKNPVFNIFIYIYIF